MRCATRHSTATWQPATDPELACMIWWVKQMRSPTPLEGDVMRPGKDIETRVGPTREAIVEQLERRYGPGVERG